MFQFPRFASVTYVFSYGYHKVVGFPIRKSTGQSLLAANRGLSQPVTSFIASKSQGIHRMHLLTLESITTRRNKIAVKQSNHYIVVF